MLDSVPQAGPPVVIAFDSEALATAARLRLAARRLARAREHAALVAVLPAMGHAEDELDSLARSVSPRPHPRELDLLVSTGARSTCALVAMTLVDGGCHAVSLSGSQAGIVTDTTHGRATVVAVRPERIASELDAGAIVLVAAGQGVSTAGEVTRLGPGGARQGAVALARALRAAGCVAIEGHPDAPPVDLLAAGTGVLPLERTA
jgi:aspartate kinase